MFEGVQPGLVSCNHDHAAQIDGQAQRAPFPCPDLFDGGQQVLFTSWIGNPILAPAGINQLSADQVLVHQAAHRVGQAEAVLQGQRTGNGQRDVPPHRVTGDRDNFDIVGQHLRICHGTGIDQGGGDIAARVTCHAEPGGGVKLGHRRTASRLPLCIETGNQLCLMRMMPREIAKLGFVVCSPTGADEDRAAGHLATRSRAAAMMPSRLGKVAPKAGPVAMKLSSAVTRAKCGTLCSAISAISASACPPV